MTMPPQQPPPGWQDPPPGWQPSPGWQPPPGWQPVPARQKKLGPFGWTGIGCGGLLGLLILFGMIGSATGGGSSGSSSSSGGGDSVVNAVAAGAVARDGDFAFRYEGIDCGPAAARAVYSSPDFTGPKPAGTTECIVRLRITDDKGTAQTFFDSNQYAYDAHGRQFSADSNGTYLTGDRDDTQLNPGVSITALVPYNIPAGDKIASLVLHDSEVSGGVTVTI
jgi:hypothetical protein